MFFLIPMNVTCERPIALTLAMICWWEALRAPEVAKWQYKCCIEWDARNGGAERTVLELASFTHQAGEKYQGAVAVVLDWAKAV